MKKRTKTFAPGAIQLCSGLLPKIETRHAIACVIPSLRSGKPRDATATDSFATHDAPLGVRLLRHSKFVFQHSPGPLGATGRFYRVLGHPPFHVKALDQQRLKKRLPEPHPNFRPTNYSVYPQAIETPQSGFPGRREEIRLGEAVAAPDRADDLVDSRPLCGMEGITRTAQRPSSRQGTSGGWRRLLTPGWPIRLLAVAILLVAFGTALAQPEPGKPLIVGSEEDYPPFALGKTDDTASGFTVELWQAVAAESALTYSIRVRPFRQILEEFKAGKIDVLINLAQSEERREFADFSVPHVIVHGAIFVRKGEAGIDSEADLDGKSIIVIQSDLAHDYAVAKGWGRQLVLVDNAANGLKRLASGKHDAMLLSKLAGMQTLVDLKIRNIKPLPVRAGFSQKFSFAVRKGNSELLAKVNEGLAIAKSTGTYDLLYEKWFGIFTKGELTYRQLLKYLGPIVVALMIAAGIFLVRQHERRKVEHLLRESEERFRKLIEHAPEAIQILDVTSGRFLQVNSASEQLFKRSAAELLRLGPVELSPPLQPDGRPSGEMVMEFLARAIAGETPVFEWTHCDAEGRDFPCEVRLLRIEIGGRILVRGSVTDISERKRSVEALEFSEKRFRTLAESAPVLIYLTDGKGDCIYVNRRWCEVSGLTPEEAAGQGWLNALHEGDRMSVGEQWKRSVQSGGTWGYEYRFQNRAGLITWIYGTAAPILAANGTVVGYVGTNIDITKRKRAELALEAAQQALQTSERYFRALIEQSSDGIVVFAEDGVARYASPAAATITGYEIAEMVGSHVLSIVHEEDLPVAESRFHQFVSKPGMTDRFEHRLRRKDGATIWIEVAAQNLLPDPAVQGIVVNYRDVTERHKAEQALRESRERHAELVRTIEGIVWEADAQTLQFNFVSEQAERLIGYPVGKWFEPDFWEDHIHPDDRAATTEYCLSSTRQGHSHDFEYRMLAADGRVVWLRDIVTVLSERGVPRLLRGIMVDITARKEAELQRQRAFDTLQLFIDSVPGYVSFVDAGQRYQLVNPGYEQWFGRKRSEIVGRHLHELQTPAAYEEMRPMVERALAGEVVRYERAVDDAAGQAHWFDIRYIPRLAPDRAVAGFFALVFDITAQKEAELALRDSRERLDGILSSLDDVVWSSTPDGLQMLYLNPAAEKIYGRPIAEFFAKPHLWLEAIHREDRATVGAAFEELQRCGTFVSEYRIVWPDGTIRWLRDRGRLVKDADGRAVRLDGIGTDITAQREAEERIRNLNIELEHRVQERTAQIDRLYRRQAALAEIELAVHQPTELQRVLDRAVAVGSEGLEARSGATIVLWDAKLECFTVSASTVPGQPAQLAALRIRRTGGASRWIVDQRRSLVVPDIREDPFRANTMLPEFGMQSYAGVPLLFEKQALGVLYVLHDQPREFSDEDVAFMQAVASRVAVAIFKFRLYERVQGVNRILEQRSAELEAANKELEAFSYSVSHDLRAPLRAIDGFSKILQQDAGSQLDEKNLRYLDRIRSGTERMGALINDMLKLSRLSRAPMNRVEVDLSLLVREALDELRAAEPERQVESVVAPDLKAEGDASLLRAVLQNFVSNAWKYTSRRQKAHLEFGAIDREGERVFFIRDDGAGFDMAYAHRLFGAFQRLHGADEFEGNGIGLATAHRIIRRHGGKVWAEGAVDQGATFYFTLTAKPDSTLSLHDQSPHSPR